MFKKRYGRFGALTRQEWKEKLNSNEGLFEIRFNGKGCLGPKFSKGKIMGDTTSIENMLFFQKADKNQKEFYNELLKENKSAALEYLLTIEGSIDIWKKDMVNLQKLLEYLQNEKSLFGEKKNLEEKNKEFIEKLLSFKRQFPEKGFLEKFELEEMILNPEKKEEEINNLLSNIMQILMKIREEEETIKNYLKNIKRTCPFLFEN